jgi:hypothetical protein
MGYQSGNDRKIGWQIGGNGYGLIRRTVFAFALKD